MKIPKYIYALSAIGTGIGAYVLLSTEREEEYLRDVSTAGKTIIVTGGTSGIGKYVAQDLAKRGGRVVVACRDVDKCIRMVGEDFKMEHKDKVVCRHLDLSSIKSIKQFATDFNTNEARLDVLVNNAGVVRRRRSVTEDGFEQHLGVNYLGRFLLTHLLLPKMQHTPGYSRIVNVVCLGYHSAKINFDDLNSELKFDTKSLVNTTSLANILFTHKLAEILEESESRVGVYAANPGLADTDLRRDMPSHNAFLSRHLLKPVWWSVFQSPKKAGKTVLYCILYPYIGHPYSSGKLYYRSTEERAPHQVMSQQTLDRLWDISVYWTKLPENYFTANHKNHNFQNNLPNYNMNDSSKGESEKSKRNLVPDKDTSTVNKAIV